MKVTVFLADIADWPAVNEVYVPPFPGAVPGAQRVRGEGAPARRARVEIEAVAAAGVG